MSDLFIMGIYYSHGGVDSAEVPPDIAKTYGCKSGVSHIDVFGYDVFYDANHNWTFENGNVYWWAEPKTDWKHAVDNHLFRLYNIKETNHKTTCDNYPKNKSEAPRFCAGKK